MLVPSKRCIVHATGLGAWEHTETRLSVIIVLTSLSFHMLLRQHTTKSTPTTQAAIKPITNAIDGILFCRTTTTVVAVVCSSQATPAQRYVDRPFDVSASTHYSLPLLLVASLLLPIRQYDSPR